MFLPSLLLVLLAVALFPPSASATAASSERPASELICHTSDPSECYPKVFEPTDEFQLVKPDQDLPPGLHVRMNIWTSEKEAKINVPDEVDPALEGLPVDQAVLVVDPQEESEPQIPKGAPAYEPVGQVKGPEHEAQSFLDAMKMLTSGVIESDEAFDTSLEALEDISHDMYYGLKTAENTDVLKALFCLMEQQGIPPVNDATPRDQQAASIISAALQNNPAALKEVAGQWESIMTTKCPASDMAVSDLFYSSFMPWPAGTSNITDEAAAPKAKAKISAIKGLIKDPSIRRQFVDNGGMERLLEVLTTSVPNTKDWTTAQRRVGQLVLDTFLDEDMGATLGEWPTVQSSKKCGPHEATAGCWEEHVGAIMKKNKSDKYHWSKHLHQALTKALKETRHQEL
ncbi:nucleotide exchange factor SIL1 domain-containing protein [Sarocladium implicatum]|nr:nucleotide exchange factor SIL1 domain-containing protein [Sarocladium implicatum]